MVEAMSRIHASASGGTLASPIPRAFTQGEDPGVTAGFGASLLTRALFRSLARIEVGRLVLRDGNRGWSFGEMAEASPFATAEILVHDPRFYRSLAWGGALGAADAFLRGWWTCDNLTGAIRVLSRNQDVLQSMNGFSSRIVQSWRGILHLWRRNTRQGSRRNIAAHYDLSNEFFSLFLDESMTYSSGIFTHPEATLLEASEAKYERICRKLELKPEDHVLEIGCGWGGFAEYAARRYRCRITGVTISRQQYEYARQRIRRAGLGDLVQLELKDYRDLTGKFDKLVSIEMIEAVGREYLPSYFQQCSRLLKENGMMALQAITIPDHRYDRYRRSVDFIQHYVFPGGFLPSLSAMADCWRKATDFRLFHLEDFGPHYAETLRRWRERFDAHADSIRHLGMDDYFMRLWTFYLCYCEGGFLERQIGVSQILLTKPACRRDAVILPWGER